MPAKSKSQQALMGMAYAYKKGELDNASDEIKKIADSMTLKELKDFASTKTDNLPDKVEENKMSFNKMYENIVEKKKEPQYKAGQSVTYLGHPAEITAVDEYNGKTYVNVSYDKGNGKTTAKQILTTDGSVKPLNEGIEVKGIDQYEFNHGKKPKGKGSWIFNIAGKEEMMPSLLTFSQAVKKAKEIAKSKGVSEIEVLP